MDFDWLSPMICWRTVTRLTSSLQSFSVSVLKWRKVLRIYIIFCVTRRKIRSRKVLSRHLTVTRHRKKGKKPFLFQKMTPRKMTRAVSVGSRARLKQTKTLSSNHCFVSNITRPINKRCDQNTEKVALEAMAECITNVLTTFWRHLWFITEQTHGNMESIH